MRVWVIAREVVVVYKMNKRKRHPNVVNTKPQPPISVKLSSPVCKHPKQQQIPILSSYAAPPCWLQVAS